MKDAAMPETAKILYHPSVIRRINSRDAKDASALPEAENALLEAAAVISESMNKIEYCRDLLGKTIDSLDGTIGFCRQCQNILESGKDPDGMAFERDQLLARLVTPVVE